MALSAHLVDRAGSDQVDVESWPMFVGLGIGLELFTIALLVVYFRRQGWF